jgi:hypothetical protein
MFALWLKEFMPQLQCTMHDAHSQEFFPSADDGGFRSVLTINNGVARPSSVERLCP